MLKQILTKSNNNNGVLKIIHRCYSSIVIASQPNIQQLYEKNKEILIKFDELNENQLNDYEFLTESLKSWCNVGDKNMAEQYSNQLINVNNSQELMLAPLLKLYNDTNDIDSGYQLMKEIESKNYQLSNWTYALWIRLLGKSKDVIKAEEIFNVLKKQGQLTTLIFDHMITLYKHAGLRKKAENLFKDMSMYHVQPTNITYGLLIETQMKDGQSNRALRTFRQMIKQGLTPTSAAYRCLLQYFHSIDDTFSFDDVVKHLYEKIEVKNIEPSVFSVLIESYLAQKRFKEAHNCIKHLKENLYPLNLYICRAAIETYLRIGLVTKAVEIYDQLLEQNVKPNTQIFSTFLIHMPKSYGHNLATQLIARLAKDMKQYELENEDKLKDQLVYAYSRFSLDFLQQLLAEYEDMNIPIKAEYHGALMKCYHRACKFQDAVEHLQQLESLNDKELLHIDAFNALACMYLHKNNNVKARQTLQRALNKHGIAPNLWTHELLIEIAFLEQKYNKAVKNYDALMKRGYTPREMTIKTMERILTERKDVGRLLEMRKILHDVELGVRKSYKRV